MPHFPPLVNTFSHRWLRRYHRNHWGSCHQKVRWSGAEEIWLPGRFEHVTGAGIDPSIAIGRGRTSNEVEANLCREAVTLVNVAAATALHDVVPGMKTAP
jgi:hypothetical protein